MRDTIGDTIQRDDRANEIKKPRQEEVGGAISEAIYNKEYMSRAIC